ncbi:MAG: peptidoglycan DD-metalloendopeptidase family protein [Pseudomonadota bacterium]
MDISALRGQPDLYAALRGLGIAAPDATTLPAILAALDAGDDLACETAARLRAVDAGLLLAVLRRGAGLPATPAEPAVRAHLATVTAAPLFLPAIQDGPSLALLTNGEHPQMPAFSDPAFDAWFAAQGVPYGIGTYGEDRHVYRSAQFADAASPERRTRHLGIDVFAPAMTPVHAPLAGTVRHVTYNADPLDYGNTLILDHQAGDVTFHTLYGHLAGTLPGLLQPGDTVDPGQVIAHLGDWPENGGWAPHLHFQVMTDMLAQTGGNFFGVGHNSLWDVWQGVCIDPNLILRLPEDRFCVR